MNFLQRVYKVHQYVPAPWLVAIALVICFFAFSLRQKAELPGYEYDLSGFPQIYMKEVETREFDAQGLRSGRRQRQRADHPHRRMRGRADGRRGRPPGPGRPLRAGP